MPTIAAVVEAGGVGEDGAGNELPREDGSGGGEVAEVGEEHHHLHSTERAPQAHGECPTCSDRNQTRGTSEARDEGRGTHRATGGHQRGEHGGGGGLHSPSRRGSVVGGGCLHYQARGPRGTSVATRTASFGLDSAQTKLGAAILFFSLQFFYSTIAWFSYKKIYYGMLCLVYF